MGRPTTYCDQCGAMIPGADFDKGVAFSERGKNYCAECGPKIPRVPGERDKQGSTRTKRTAVDAPRDSDIIRNLQGLGARPQTTRIAHEHASPPAAKGLSPAVIGAVAGGALLLVLLLVFAASGSGDGGASSETESAALAACEAAEAQRGKVPAKDWLNLALTAKRISEGTKHQGRAAALCKEAQALAEAEEKVQKITRDLARLVQEARGASKPEIYMAEFDRLREAARRDAPELVARVDEEAAGLCTYMILKQVEQVDLGLAGTPHGYRRVLELLDDVAKKSAGSKAAATEIDKKRAAAKAAFEKGGAEAAADLDRRLQVMLKEARYDEADRAVKMFEDDYRGTPVEGKAAELRGAVAKAKAEFEKSWTVPALGDFAKELGDAKASEAGGVISLIHEGAEAAVADDTRRISFAKNDKAWGNYELHFEVQLEKVGAVLLMRTMSNPPIRVNLPVAVGNTQGLPASRWYRVTVRVIGTKAELGGDLTPQKADVADGTGGFAFVVQPGARFQVRNVKARQIK